MNFYHLDVHINFCYTYESSRYDLVQFGPLDMISQQMLLRVSAILQGISSEDVPFAWWREFSTWQDFPLASLDRHIGFQASAFPHLPESPWMCGEES